MRFNLGNIDHPVSQRGFVWRKKDGGALSPSVNGASSLHTFCNTNRRSELVCVLFGNGCTTLHTEHTRKLEGNVASLLQSC